MSRDRNDPRRAFGRGIPRHPSPRLRRAGVLACWLVAAIGLASCGDMAPPPPEDWDSASGTAVEDAVVTEVPTQSSGSDVPVAAVVAAPVTTPPVVVEGESEPAPEGIAPAVQRTVAPEPVAAAPTLRVYQMGPVRGPRMGGLETSHDWGVAMIGTEVRHTYQFRNAGDQPIKILRASQTLGCASVTFDREIPPGEFGKVEVVVRTAQMNPGRSRMVIELQTSDRRSDTTLLLQGRVEHPREMPGAIAPAAAAMTVRR